LYPDIKIVDHSKCRVKIRELERRKITEMTRLGIQLLNDYNIKLDDIILPKGRVIPMDIFINLEYQINRIIDTYEQ